MNPTVSQVATPTTAIFPDQPMADVIDSLKRLDRLGDENSKTVQKILHAAQDIENRILELYAGCAPYTEIDCSAAFDRKPPDPEDPNFESNQRKFLSRATELGISPELYGCVYRICPIGSSSRLFRKSSRFTWGRLGPAAYADEEIVSETRDAALRFANDIAKGLLIAIAADLARQKGDNDTALTTLDAAKVHMHGKKDGGARRVTLVRITPGTPGASHNEVREVIERRIGRKIKALTAERGSAGIDFVLAAPIELNDQTALDTEAQIVNDLKLQGVRIEFL